MADPVDLDKIEQRCALAYEELLRVTGMGHYAQRVQGGPPNPPRATIPADVDRDTDLIIGESLDNVRKLVAEVRRLRAVLEKYQHCRHGCPDCFCVREALDAALAAKDGAK